MKPGRYKAKGLQGTWSVSKDYVIDGIPWDAPGPSSGNDEVVLHQGQIVRPYSKSRMALHKIFSAIGVRW